MILIYHFTFVSLKFAQYIYDKTYTYQVPVSLDVNTYTWNINVIES